MQGGTSAAFRGRRGFTNARAQGKFWEYAALLFANQRAQSRTDLLDHAAALGLDWKQFESDLSKHKFEERVRADMADATSLKKSGTPTFSINGHKYMGGKHDVRDLIAAELAQ